MNTTRQRPTRTLASLVCVLSMATAAQAVVLAPGDIVVGANLGTTTNQDFALLLVNPTTGDRTVISDDSTGTGPTFDFSPATAQGGIISDISYQPDGSLLVVDTGTEGGKSQLIRVDPATGNRTIVSDLQANPGTGIYYAASDFGNSILLETAFGLFTVDPATGNSSVFPAGGGTGPEPNFGGFVVSGTNVYAAGASTPGIIEANSVTGIRTIVSGGGVGTGPTISVPMDVALGNAGNLLLLDYNTLLLVDPATGDRTVLSSSTVGTGPDLSSWRIGVTATGSVITDTGWSSYQTPGQILSIDPVTGNRTLLSDPTHGTGPSFFDAGGLLIVPSVPEPSTMILAALGGLALLVSAPAVIWCIHCSCAIAVSAGRCLARGFCDSGRC